jgi:small conductance mechanosensitive channel
MLSTPRTLALTADVTAQRLHDVCGADPGTACRWVLEQTDNRWLAHLADNVIGPILQIIIIWIVAVLVNRVVRLAIKRIGRHIEGAAFSGRLQKMRDRTPNLLLETGAVGIRSAARAKTTTLVLRSVASVIIYSLAILYSLAVLGAQVGPLIAGAGIVGVALGFGAQSMVRDFLGGVFLLIEDQFGVGDQIDVASTVDGSPGVSGSVEAVTLRTTSIRDVKGTIWHIPNGEIRRVGNMSQGWARALLDLPVPYDSDIDHVIEVIQSVADEVCHSSQFGPEILGEPEIWGVEDLGADAVVVRLVIKTRPGEQWAIMRALRVRVLEAFTEAGIGRPFAQRTVWLRGDDGSEGAKVVGPPHAE